MALFPRAVPTGLQHGTVTVPTETGNVEVTTFRSEGGYADGRHPDAVAFGVTLEEDNTARFPDAPTLRGVKHLEELIAAREAGYEAGVCFIVQMAGMDHVEPNDATHPEFGAALRRAADAGVEILALECVVEPGRLTVGRRIPVRL